MTGVPLMSEMFQNFVYIFWSVIKDNEDSEDD